MADQPKFDDTPQSIEGLLNELNENLYITHDELKSIYNELNEEIAEVFAQEVTNSANYDPETGTIDAVSLYSILEGNKIRQIDLKTNPIVAREVLAFRVLGQIFGDENSKNARIVLSQPSWPTMIKPFLVLATIGKLIQADTGTNMTLKKINQLELKHPDIIADHFFREIYDLAFLPSNIIDDLSANEDDAVRELLMDIETITDENGESRARTVDVLKIYYENAESKGQSIQNEIINDIKYQAATLFLSIVYGTDLQDPILREIFNYKDWDNYAREFLIEATRQDGFMPGSYVRTDPQIEGVEKRIRSKCPE